MLDAAMRLHVLVLVLSLVAPLATATPRAWAGPPDADGDGVADRADACPGTAAYELVDDDGCSVCPCEHDWTSRVAYLRCVYDAARERREAGDLSARKGRAVAKAARASTCGRPTWVRCCIAFPEKGTGSCRVMDALRCDAELVRTEHVADAGPGSCLPNPCDVP
jgi:hypothetical protein